MLGVRRWMWARWALRRYADLAPGSRDGDRVRVDGVVRAAGEPLIAPLSGRPCVAYRARARFMGNHRAPIMAQRPSVCESLQVRPFAIDRAAGDDVVVVAEHALLGMPTVELPDFGRKVSFLALHGLPNGGARFSEVVVEPGMRITVAGTLVLVPPEEPPQDERGFRDPPPLEPRLVGSRDAPLVIVAG